MNILIIVLFFCPRYDLEQDYRFLYFCDTCGKVPVWINKKLVGTVIRTNSGKDVYFVCNDCYGNRLEQQEINKQRRLSGYYTRFDEEDE